MIRLHTADADFATRFAALVDARREASTDVADSVARIIARVRSEGEEAVADLTLTLDRHDLATTGWRIDPADCAAAYAALDPDLRDALDLAATRIRAYHEKQRPADTDYIDDVGVRLGARWLPVERGQGYTFPAGVRPIPPRC